MHYRSSVISIVVQHNRTDHQLTSDVGLCRTCYRQPSVAQAVGDFIAGVRVRGRDRSANGHTRRCPFN